MQGSRPLLLTVAWYVLVEARRSALPWLAAASVVAALGLASFLSQVAITEAAALQESACAALLRACAVFLIAAHVAASVVREANDKGLELALALPMPRPSWYLGKLLGFAAAGALIAALFALPLLAWAKPADLAAWWLALSAEAAVVAAASLFFASALGQTVAAISATLGLYLLARSIAAIQAIAASPVADSAAGQAAHWLVDGLALLLPRLDGIARGDWLLYGAPAAADLAAALAGLVIYFVLLTAAGLFDFSRKNL
jgi:ABC-type transport system involved in multi-copper enzyme maturation permease subunit